MSPILGRIARIVVAAAVVVLCLALLDVAFEAVFRGSPLWPVAVAANVIAAASLLVAGRRAFGETSALVLFAAVLALFAWSGWSLGSLEAPGSIRFTRLPADVCVAYLVLAVAAGLLYAVIRVPKLPRVARVVLTLVVIYGALPVIWSLYSGAGFDRALRTNAPLPGDPFFLRGAYVAVEVFFPVAALAFLALGAAGLIQRHVAFGRRALAAALVCAIAAQMGSYQAAALELPSLVAFERREGGPLALDRAVNPVVVAFPDDVAPDVKQQAAQLGATLSALFAFVANSITDDIYDGALRGSSGTLATGSGNAVDKAVLLRDLVRANDPNAQTRFAFCTLPASDAQGLVNAILAQSHPRPKLVIENADVLAQAAPQGSDERGMLSHWASSWHDLTQTAVSETAALTSALAGAKASSNAGPSAIAQLPAIAAQHVWLEVYRDAAWVDLDPTLGTKGFGHARCAAAQTASTLPDERYDRVVVRVRVERWTPGHLGTSDALAAAVRTADLSGRHLSFQLSPMRGMLGASPAESAPSPASTASPTVPPYLPILQISTQTLVGTPIAMPTPASSDQSMTGGIAQLGQAFGNATPSPSAPQSTAGSPSEVTAVWLRVEPLSPRGASDPVIETLFDRVGPALRQAPAPQTLADPAAGVPIAAPWQVWSIAVWTGASAGGVGDSSGSGSAQDETVTDPLLVGLGGLQSRFAVLRNALFAAAAPTASPGYMILGPSISLVGIGADTVNPDDPLGVTTDIASDRTRPLIGSSVSLPPSTAAAWAIASILAERIIGGGGQELAPPQTLPNALYGHDAISTFAAARRANIALKSLGPSDRAATATLGATADSRARIGDQLAAGSSVIAPVSTPPGADFGWWVIDPADASVRDEMWNGRHQDTTEYQEAQQPSGTVSFMQKVRRLCLPFFVIMGGISAATGSLEGLKSSQSALAKLGSIEEETRKRAKQCKRVGGGPIGG
jgi:hypothetical protein